MQVYLPIAGLPVDIMLLLFLGVITGILSGIFGIGGGFLMTPILIFMGVPPAVAVSSSANQIIASSISGFMAHWQRKNVDLKMGTTLLIGGGAGSICGVKLFIWLNETGLINLIISLSYVLFLGTIGLLMLVESVKVIIYKRRNMVISGTNKPNRLQQLKLPLVVYFPHSNIHMSIIIPILIGFLAGMLVSIMGIGGGFVMVPAMIYMLGMTTQIAVGTSLFQIIFTTIIVTFLQAINTHTVDIILTIIMLAGSVTGAQFGTRIAVKLPAEQLRVMLAVILLLLVARLAYGLFVEPNSFYEIDWIE